MAYNYDSSRGEYVQVVQTKATIAKKKDINHVFAVANTDEVIATKPPAGKIGIVYVIAEATAAAVSPTVTLKDGTTPIAKWTVPGGDAKTLIFCSLPIEIDGDLVAQVNDLGVSLSTWWVEN